MFGPPQDRNIAAGLRILADDGNVDMRIIRHAMREAADKLDDWERRWKDLKWVSTEELEACRKQRSSCAANAGMDMLGGGTFGGFF